MQRSPTKCRLGHAKDPKILENVRRGHFYALTYFCKMSSFVVGNESLEELESRHAVEMCELEEQIALQLKTCKKKER